MTGTNVAEDGDEEAARIAAETAAGEAVKEVEGRARRMGWRPRDEFRGDPARWTDAQTFIDRGEAELPILRDRYRALDDKLVRTADELKEVKDRLGEVGSSFKEFREFSRNAAEREYLRGKREIEAKMQAAVDSADRIAYQSAKAELDSLDPPPPAPKPAAEERPAPAKPAAIDHEIPLWVADNPWFNADEDMNAVATALHGKLLQQKPGMSMRENLAEVRRKIVQMFPDKFENKKREEAAAVSGPTGGTTKKKTGKTFEDLPADAKAAYEKFKIQMPDYKKEEYLRMYFAGDEA